MDFNDILSKAKDMQKIMSEKQKNAETQIIETSVGGGMVKMTMNGKFELLSVKIDPEIVDKNDVETLEDLIRAAVNDLNRKNKDQVTSGLGDLLGGLKIPGMDL